MSPLVLAVVASALIDGGAAIALDDGTVWLVYDDEWEELGGCDDGQVVALDAALGELAIECADGSSWRWSEHAGWAPAPPADAGAEPPAPHLRSYWPLLELSVQAWTTSRSEPAFEGWVRLRWDL